MKCKFCEFETDNKKVYANHIRWKHRSPVGSDSYNEYTKKLADINKNNAKYFELELICPQCGNKFIQTISENTYNKNKYRKNCSIKCANSQGSKYVDYAKISKYAKANPKGWADPNYNIEQNPKAHSKRELEIVNYFKEHFKDDDWKIGFLKGKEKLTPDLHSDKLKVVIEYDGIWHFKDINNQLQRKQEVDRSILKWCKKNNYRLIRIDEDLRLPIDSIVDAVYKDDKQLELFNSNRYSYLFE